MAMGEGSIEGVPEQYVMSSAFATDFAFSRFGSTSASARNVSAHSYVIHAVTKSCAMQRVVGRQRWDAGELYQEHLHNVRLVEKLGSAFDRGGSDHATTYCI